MEAVRDLDQDNPHIVREGQEDLPEVFGLLGGVGIEYAGHLRQAVDHRGDLGTENALHVLDGALGVLDDIVQQGRDDRLDTESDFVDDDLGYCNRMQEVWLAGRRRTPLMSLFGEENARLIRFQSSSFLQMRVQARSRSSPLFLDERFILGSISHRLLPFSGF